MIRVPALFVAGIVAVLLLLAIVTVGLNDRVKDLEYIAEKHQSALELITERILHEHVTRPCESDRTTLCL